MRCHHFCTSKLQWLQCTNHTKTHETTLIPINAQEFRSPIDDFPETGQIRITTFKYAKKTSTNFCKWISLEILKYLKNFPASCLSATLPQLPRLQLVEPREGSLQRTSCVSYVFGQLYDKHDINCRHCIIINHKFDSSSWLNMHFIRVATRFIHHHNNNVLIPGPSVTLGVMWLPAYHPLSVLVSNKWAHDFQ